MTEVFLKSSTPRPRPGPASSVPAEVAAALTDSYKSDPRGHRIGRRFWPSREAIFDALQLIVTLLYPGYYGRHHLPHDEVQEHIEGTLTKLRGILVEQIERCLCHDVELQENESAPPPPAGRCRAPAEDLTDTFLRQLPELRVRLIEDLQAAFDGDPAAQHLDEIVLAYPGFLAVTVYRIAHELHTLGVPLMPRILSEWAHTRTGADIHPGAEIGSRFFIDHATGAVVGETSTIGDNVRIYQGVTLGALSIVRGADGRVVRGSKRHPTVEDDVTIYANATVLGGNTVLGQGSVIGGSVFVTKTIPQGSRVALAAPEPRVRSAPPPPDSGFLDFEI